MNPLLVASIAGFIIVIVIILVFYANKKAQVINHSTNVVHTTTTPVANTVVNTPVAAPVNNSPTSSTNEPVVQILNLPDISSNTNTDNIKITEFTENLGKISSIKITGKIKGTKPTTAFVSIYVRILILGRRNSVWEAKITPTKTDGNFYDIADILYDKSSTSRAIIIEKGDIVNMSLNAYGHDASIGIKDAKLEIKF